MFKQLQQVGKAFMLPIAILPAAGLLLGIGGALSNKATVQAYPLLDNPVLQGIFRSCRLPVRWCSVIWHYYFV